MVGEEEGAVHVLGHVQHLEPVEGLYGSAELASQPLELVMVKRT